MPSFSYIGSSKHCENDSKIGKSSNLYSRESSLESSYSRFAFVFQMLIICTCDVQALKIEKYLHEQNWNHSTTRFIGNGAGIEWFDKKFTKEEIEQQLVEGGYLNKVINDIDEINSYIEPLKRDYEKKEHEYIQKMNHHSRLTNSLVKPYEIQEREIIQINIDYFTKYDIGKNILPPGTGKTLCSLFTALSMGSKRICIGVPSIALVQQWIEQIKLVFTDIPILGIATNSTYNSEFTTNKDKIDTFIKQDKCCVVVVYDSCHKLVGQTFDFKIGDECHHLTGEYDPTKDIRAYTQFHRIKSNKSLFITGTSKTLTNMTTDRHISSMDDVELFGNVIVEKSILWAIEHNLITDYRPIVLRNKEDDIIDISRKYGIDVTNIELFLAAVMTLKTFIQIDGLSHVFVYANSIKNAEIINNYITEILEKEIFDIDKNDVYNNALCSNGNPNINKDDPTSEICKFSKQKYGVISCVYMFGEGYDLPMLNGVVFAENMGSEIRIVQSTTRCFRKDKSNLSKIAYVIIPYLDTDDWRDDNNSFKKVRDIVYHIGNKDETIGTKLVIRDINKTPLSLKQLIMKHWKRIIKKDNESRDDLIDDFIDDSDDEYLSTIIKLRLRRSRALQSRVCPLEYEFIFMKERNKHLKLSSKSDYKLSSNCEEYVDNPDRCFELYWNNWYDFLGYDISNFIQTKEEWIIECKKNNIKSFDNYKRLCENDLRFPINPSEFYQHYTNFNNELNLNTQRRR